MYDDYRTDNLYPRLCGKHSLPAVLMPGWSSSTKKQMTWLILLRTTYNVRQRVLGTVIQTHLLLYSLPSRVDSYKCFFSFYLRTVVDWNAPTHPPALARSNPSVASFPLTLGTLPGSHPVSCAAMTSHTPIAGCSWKNGRTTYQIPLSCPVLVVVASFSVGALLLAFVMDKISFNASYFALLLRP